MEKYDFSRFAPVSGPEAAAVRDAAARDTPPAVPAPVPVEGPAATSTPAFRVIGGPTRSRIVPLTYPIGNGETKISAIVVRRMSVAELRMFMDAAVADEAMHVPMFELPDGQPVPSGALDALDADDWATLDKVAHDFLPLTFRGRLAGAPAPETGGASPG